MFVPCIIRHGRNNQQYALICTTPLFYILAPTCFGSSLPSSGSFLDPSEWLCGMPHNHTLYDIPPFRFVFQVTRKELRNSLMMQATAKTCRSQCIEQRSGTNQCIVLVISTTNCQVL
jgi:hypothetical protein